MFSLSVLASRHQGEDEGDADARSDWHPQWDACWACFWADTREPQLTAPHPPPPAPTCKILCFFFSYFVGHFSICRKTRLGNSTTPKKEAPPIVGEGETQQQDTSTLHTHTSHSTQHFAFGTSTQTSVRIAVAVCCAEVLFQPSFFWCCLTRCLWKTRHPTRWLWYGLGTEHGAHTHETR